MIKKFLEKVKREAGEFFDGTVPGMEESREIRTFMEITKNPPRSPYKVVNSRPQLSRDEILEMEASLQEIQEEWEEELFAETLDYEYSWSPLNLNYDDYDD